MPGQTFQVLQCYSCRTYQVQQRKKVNKWVCKMCGEKQSIKKIYGEGSGADCRVHVQKLNRLRGELESSSTEQTPSLMSSKDEVFAGGEMDGETETVRVNRVQESKWGEYCEKEGEEGEEGGTGGGEMWTTDRQQYNNTQRKRKKNMYDQGHSQQYKSKRSWEQPSKIQDWPESDTGIFTWSDNANKSHNKYDDESYWSQDIHSSRMSHQDLQSTRISNQNLQSIRISHEDVLSTRMSLQGSSPQWNLQNQRSGRISQSQFSKQQDSDDQTLSKQKSARYETEATNQHSSFSRTGEYRASVNSDVSNLGESRRKQKLFGTVSTKSKWSTFIEEKEDSDDSESENSMNCHSSYQNDVTEAQFHGVTARPQSQEETSLSQQGETTVTNQREATLTKQEETTLYSVVPRNYGSLLDSNENRSPTQIKCNDQHQRKRMSDFSVSKRYVDGQSSNDDTKRKIVGQTLSQNGQVFSCVDKSEAPSMNSGSHIPTALFSLGDVDEDDLNLELKF